MMSVIEVNVLLVATLPREMVGETQVKSLSSVQREGGKKESQVVRVFKEEEYSYQNHVIDSRSEAAILKGQGQVLSLCCKYFFCFV